MTKQERMVDMINQRLNELDLLIQKLNKVIEILEHGVSPKENVEPLMTFKSANNVNNNFIEDRQKEIFQELDRK